VHAGEKPDPATGASAPNLVMSTTFVADPDTSFSVEHMGEDHPFFYTRWANPTVDQLETKLADLEGAEACIAFGSGMAAVTALFLYHLSSGDHLVISDVSYAGTAELTLDLLPKMGVEVTRVNMSDLDEVAGSVTDKTKLVYMETPCNPIIRLSDIAAVAKLKSTTTVMYKIYHKAFVEGDIGMGNAMTTVTALCLLGISIFTVRYLKDFLG